MENLVQCFGKGINFHENTTINFNGSGLVLGVSLNVPKEIIDYLPSNCIKHGKKMSMLFFSKQINSVDVDVFMIQKVHDYLLKNLMYHIRVAKSNYFKREANKIKEML